MFDNVTYLTGLAVMLLLTSILLFAMGDPFAGLIGLGVTCFVALLVLLEARGRRD
jgi:hypothetical protein